MQSHSLFTRRQDEEQIALKKKQVPRYEYATKEYCRLKLYKCQQTFGLLGQLKIAMCPTKTTLELLSFILFGITFKKRQLGQFFITR